MFQGLLPEISFHLFPAKSYCGKMFYNLATSHAQMRISTAVAMEEAELEDVIIHEMIHLFIFHTGQRDTSSHGQLFKSIMGRINQQYGRHITISHRSTSNEPNPIIGKKGKINIIAVVEMKDGRKGFKVLPKTAKSIMAYYNFMSHHKDIRSVKIYKCDNDYFSQFPTSAALRVHFPQSNDFLNYISARNLIK